VEKTHGQCEGSDDDTTHLTRAVRIKDDHRSDNHLNDRELGDERDRETLAKILGFGSGGGRIEFHLLAVSWHVYYILRN